MAKCKNGGREGGGQDLAKLFGAFFNYFLVLDSLKGAFFIGQHVQVGGGCFGHGKTFLNIFVEIFKMFYNLRLYKIAGIKQSFPRPYKF